MGPVRTVLLAFAAAALAAPAAHAATPKPFGVLDCVERDGTRFCEGSVAKRVATFDGVPLDANVTLPAEGDGPWPLVIGFHGFGSPKRGFADQPPHEGPRRLAQRGIAVLNYQSRGFRASCGSVESRLADPAGCAAGWVHLDDVRYEVRDAQELAGRLVDEGIADPQRIGAFADSYGGQPTLFLGLLRDRKVLGAVAGEEDGKLVPWRSPKGRQLTVQAVAPYQTWSDLPRVLLPNGRGLDYAAAGVDDSLEPVGVPKLAFIAGLYATGQAGTEGVIGYFAPPGVDTSADLGTWTSRLAAGEPYDGDPIVAGILGPLHRRRSPVTVPLDRRPAAMILASGWADDLFGADEMLRVRSHIQAAWPTTPIGVYLADFGHQRTGNEQADVVERNDWFVDLFDHYLRDRGPRPALGFRARPVTCPVGNGSGPLRSARTWAALHPGEVRFRSPDPQTVLSLGGDPQVALEFTPVTANDPCKTVAAADAGTGTATYRLPAATGSGYTLMGSPTVIAKLDAAGAFPQLATRLWDVSPEGRQLLIVRSVLRPRAGGAPEPFQLPPAGWHVAPGHVLKLELLGSDAPHFRPSNGAFTVVVSDLDLRLPVAEAPGVEQVAAPAPHVFPPGVTPAADLAPPPSPRTQPLRVAVSFFGRRTRCSTRTARVRLTGAGTASVRRMTVLHGGRTIGRDTRAPFAVRVTRRAVRNANRVRLRVRVVLEGGVVRVLSARVRFCR